METRDEKVAEAHTMIEKDLELFGCTAIEDKLQEDVGNTVNFLKLAGIHVWVLTGDKVATAINIGKAAGLIDKNTHYRKINANENFHQFCVEYEKVMDDLEEQLEKRDSSTETGNRKKKVGLVIQSDVITTITTTEGLQERFFDIMDKLDVVLACRVSPKQKADIVNLVKKKHSMKTMLAIGDGANDVSMIQAANVGVGIVGREGQ